MIWSEFQQIEISVTTHCQASCPTCVRTETDTLKKVSWLKVEHLNLEIYTKFINKIKNTGIKLIVICGDYGDPLMHPQIEDIIKMSTDRGFYIDVHTNGGLRSKEWFRKIALLYGKKIKMIFGIDGTDSNTSSKYRIGVDFNRAFENMIEYASVPDSRVMWDFLLFNFNKHQIEDAYQIAKKHKIELYFKINTREYKDFKITNLKEIELLKRKSLEYRQLTKRSFTYD